MNTSYPSPARILVTGGAGYLGQHVVRRLVHEGRLVRCHARSASQWAGPDAGIGGGTDGQVEFVAGDLIDEQVCERAVLGCDVVVHVASSLRGSVSALFLNNVVATRRLIAAALKNNVKRFVHVSSIAVQGVGHLPRGSIVDEDCPLEPNPHWRDPYTYSKIAQEQVVRDAIEKQRLPAVIVRPAVIYGPSRPILSARVGLQLGGVMIRMGGRQRLPYVFVENCAAAIAAAAVAPGIEGRALNLVDDQLPTGKKLLKAYRRSGGRIRTIPIPSWAIQSLSWICQAYSRWSGGMIPPVVSPYRSAAMWRSFRFANARAKELLAWSPDVGLEEALRRSLEVQAR